LKNQTLIAGISCLLLGGIFGFFAGQQVERSRQQTAKTDAPTVAESPSNMQLPEGHPPIPAPAEVETLKKAVDAAPNNTAMVTELANKLYDSGKFQEAVDYYQRVMVMEPKNINVMTDLGTALFYSGKPNEAIAQFNRSLEINPRHVQALHNLVIVNWQGKKDLKAASAALERLEAIDPSDASIPSLRKMLTPGTAPTTANPRKRIF
jgi:Tfp pilus assembly protein PilF